MIKQDVCASARGKQQGTWGTYPTMFALAAPCRPTCPSVTLQPSNPATPAAEKLSPSSASTINCQMEIGASVLPRLHRSQTKCWPPGMGIDEGLCTQLTGLVTCAACNACCTVSHLLSKERVDTTGSPSPQFVTV